MSVRAAASSVFRRRRGAPMAMTTAAVAAGLLLAACSSSGGGSNPATSPAGTDTAGTHTASTPAKSMTSVKLSTNGAYIAYAPLFVAQAKGYFKQQGLDLQISINSNTQAAAAALVNNNVQFSLLSATHAWQSDLSGRPTTIIAANDKQLMQTLVISKAAYEKAGLTKSSSLTDRIKAMRGLTFGARSLTSQDGATLLNVLKYAGLSKADAKFVTLTSPPALVSAMKAKHIDGFVSGAPFPQEVVSQGLAVSLVDLQAGEFPPFKGMIADVYATNETFRKQHPEAVQEFVNAIAMADRYIHLHPADAASALHATKDFEALPADLLTSQITAMAKSSALPADPTVTEESLSKGLPLLQAALGKEPKLDVTSTFTNEYAAKSVSVATAQVN